jgi:hypothetical protein
VGCTPAESVHQLGQQQGEPQHTRSRAAYDNRKVLQGSRAEPICVCLDLLILSSAVRARMPCGSCNRQLQLCNVQHVQTFASREGDHTEHLCRTQDTILLSHTVLNCRYASLFTLLVLALCKRPSAHVRQSYCTFATQSPALWQQIASLLFAPRFAVAGYLAASLYTCYMCTKLCCILVIACNLVIACDRLLSAH